MIFFEHEKRILGASLFVIALIIFNSSTSLFKITYPYLIILVLLFFIIKGIYEKRGKK
jgi:hypothetical protein